MGTCARSCSIGHWEEQRGGGDQATDGSDSAARTQRVPLCASQVPNKTEIEQVLSASARRLAWVTAHIDTYERRPVVFVPKGAGYEMRSMELFPNVCGRVGAVLKCILNGLGERINE